MAKRQPVKAGYTTIFWLDEGDDPDSPGSPIQVPLSFLSELKGEVLRLQGFNIKVRDKTVYYYRRNESKHNDYTFSIGNLTYQQLKMVYG